MALTVGEIVTDAEVETDGAAEHERRPRRRWEERALLDDLDRDRARDAARTAAFGNDD